MSLRVGFGVVLAVAVVAAAQPAVHEAGVTRAERAVERDAAALARAAADLLADEHAVPPGERGARRVVSFRLPARSVTNAGVEYVAVGGHPVGVTGIDGGSAESVDTDRSDVVTYRVGGGPVRRHRLGVDIRTARQVDGRVRLRSDGEPLVFRATGRVRVVVRLVRVDGSPTVVVTAVDSVASSPPRGRGFKSEAGTNRRYAAGTETAVPPPGVRGRPNRRRR